MSGGIEFDDAWLVTEGWGNDPMMIFPDEDSARAAAKMMTGTNIKADRLRDWMASRERTIKKTIITRLDREWTQARETVTWDK